MGARRQQLSEFPMSPGTYSFTATYQGNSTFNSSVGTLGNFKCTAATRK